MSFTATWMELDSPTKSERERQMAYITYLWNLKYGTDEPIYRTEIVPQTMMESRLVVAKREDEGVG